MKPETIAESQKLVRKIIPFFRQIPKTIASYRILAIARIVNLLSHSDACEIGTKRHTQLQLQILLFRRSFEEIALSYRDQTI